jgi:predicted enzyme related to lactoylglutathione lyase
VTDQDRAVAFYVGKLGFEKHRDEPAMGDQRWIEVSPPGADTRLVLFTPPGLEDRIGTFQSIVFAVDDVTKTHAQFRDAGVEISQELGEQPWGLWFQFKDPDGNEFGVLEPA